MISVHKRDCPTLTRGWYIKADPVRCVYEADKKQEEIQILSIKDFLMFQYTSARLVFKTDQEAVLVTSNQTLPCKVIRICDLQFSKEIYVISPI
jgi:hypothetical protein